MKNIPKFFFVFFNILFFFHAEDISGVQVFVQTIVENQPVTGSVVSIGYKVRTYFGPETWWSCRNYYQ